MRLLTIIAESMHPSDPWYEHPYDTHHLDVTANVQASNERALATTAKSIRDHVIEPLKTHIHAHTGYMFDVQTEQSRALLRRPKIGSNKSKPPSNHAYTLNNEGADRCRAAGDPLHWVRFIPQLAHYCNITNEQRGRKDTKKGTAIAQSLRETDEYFEQLRNDTGLKADVGLSRADFLGDVGGQSLPMSVQPYIPYDLAQTRFDFGLSRAQFRGKVTNLSTNHPITRAIHDLMSHV